MKSMLFKIEEKDLAIHDNPDRTSISHYIWNIHIPTLPAFSVEYFEIQYGPLGDLSDDIDSEIKGDNIVISSEYGSIETFADSGVFIKLHYHGIRDYALLFPWIEDTELRTRIGKFYEEAERSFNQGAWLSFALMCGGVFEGMLYAKLGMPNLTFSNMIHDAHVKKKIVSVKQKDIMHDVRNARNLIHANNFNKDYVTRKKAMDIMTTMDKLIKQFSY
ncbi:DUF4145 domain-containing protein [Priestia filamentosa]|nr:DUF4145 domain-containing protein [Priestia filamentosa]